MNLYFQIPSAFASRNTLQYGTVRAIKRERKKKHGIAVEAQCRTYTELKYRHGPTQTETFHRLFTLPARFYHLHVFTLDDFTLAACKEPCFGKKRMAQQNTFHRR